MSMRIAKRIAATGLCSRREAERWIEAGRVTLNGKEVSTPATLVTSDDHITVDGTPLPASTENAPRLFAFHKPTNVLVTENDPQGRPTIYTVLPKIKNLTDRLIPVGRLDINSEGLLLLTNSPTLATKLMQPSKTQERIYRVRTFGQLSQSQEEKIKNGITIEGMTYAPCKLKLDRSSGRNAWYLMTLTEGKNREIRRIFEHFDIKVNRLIRIQYAHVKLDDLPAGKIKEVSNLK